MQHGKRAAAACTRREREAWVVLACAGFRRAERNPAQMAGGHQCGRDWVRLAAGGAPPVDGQVLIVPVLFGVVHVDIWAGREGWVAAQRAGAPDGSRAQHAPAYTRASEVMASLR